MDTQPYLTQAAAPIDKITIRPLTDTLWDYQLTLGNAAYLHITAKDADDLVLTLLTRLYDDDHLSMDTADRIAYLCQNVIADREMPMSHTTISGDPWLITKED